MCICMHFRIYFSNFSQSNTVCTSDLLTWWDECLCMNRGGRNKNRSTAQYCVCSRANLCCSKTKGC